MLFVTKGHFFLGSNKIDKETEEVVEARGPQFVEADDGPCVVVGKLDSETMQPVSDGACVFGDYDAAGYLEHVMKLLPPAMRKPNIPDFKGMIQKAYRRWPNECPMLEDCSESNCDGCLIRDWLDEVDEELREAQHKG